MRNIGNSSFLQLAQSIDSEFPMELLNVLRVPNGSVRRLFEDMELRGV